MKCLIPLMLAGISTLATAAGPGLDLPSCDLKTQRAVPGEVSATLTDPRQAHVSVRANVLQADISTARKARQISERQASRYFQRVENVRSQSDRLTKKQGFLSAAERASFDRKFDTLAGYICQPHKG